MLLDGLWLIFLIAPLFIIWLVALSFWLYKINAHYSRLIKGAGKASLKEVLDKLLINQEEVEAHLKKLESSTLTLDKQGQFHFQKMGILRFNPFSETGGEQSFALALLDRNESGVVLLSLHSREGTRIYAKPIKNGKSRYNLSKEELQALEEARKSGKNQTNV